jgi:cyclin-dependent kinase 7
MAISPVVTHTAETLQLAKSISSPFKTLASSGQVSSNGTPNPPAAAGAAPSTGNVPTMDLAEQMNEEEKKKYVKGMISATNSSIPCFADCCLPLPR